MQNPRNIGNYARTDYCDIHQHDTQKVSLEPNKDMNPVRKHMSLASTRKAGRGRYSHVAGTKPVGGVPYQEMMQAPTPDPMWMIKTRIEEARLATDQTGASNAGRDSLLGRQRHPRTEEDLTGTSHYRWGDNALHGSRRPPNEDSTTRLGRANKAYTSHPKCLKVR